MNVIDFPGNRGGREATPIERAVELKQRLVHFVLEGPMRDAFDVERESRGLRSLEAHALIDFTDWFIFAWEGDDGACVLDEFLDADPGMDDADRRILEGWYEAVDDVFEVVGREPEGFVLRDDDGDLYTAVPTAVAAEDLAWPAGARVSTRLLPVEDVYILSGVQSLADDARAFDTFAGDLDDEAFSDQVSGMMGVLTQLLADAFVEFFGSAEVVVPAAEAAPRLRAFLDFALEEYTPEGSDEPLGQILEEALGAVPPIDVGLSAERLGDGDVGMLVDPSEGIAVVPGYGAVRRYAETGEGDVEVLRELALDMLESDEVPPFVFYVLADIPESRFGVLLADALDDAQFDIDEDLEDLLSEYKPDRGDADGASGASLVVPEDLVDVRDVPPADREPGSLAEALAAHAAVLERELDGAALRGRLEGLALLDYYGRERGIRSAADLDVASLRDFLGEWYVRRWSARDVEGARELLATVGAFAAWLDEARGTVVGADLAGGPMRALERDLPRVVGAAVAMDAVQEADVESELDDFEALLAARGGDFEFEFGGRGGGARDAARATRAGRFEVTGVDGEIVRVDEISTIDGGLAAGEEGTEHGPVSAVRFPAAVAGMLRPGDHFEAEVAFDGTEWALVDLLGVYPPPAGRA